MTQSTPTLLYLCFKRQLCTPSNCSQQNHRNLLQKHFSSLSLLESSFKMSKIIVYSRPSFEGRSAEFMYDVSNLAEKGFDNSIASIKVIGEPWVAYYDKKFAGKQQVFEQGEYATFEDKDKFSSLKKVTADLTDPEIQLFEHVNYGGRSVILRKETNLQEITFSNIASSHKVTRGVWVLYDGINRQGFQLIAFPGEQVSNYGALCFNNKASCVRPLLPRP